MQNTDLVNHSKFWDRFVILVASLCILHCILFPLIILALPASRALIQNPLLEGIILFLGIIIGTVSFTTTYKKHRQPYPMMVGLTGVAFLSVNLFVFPEGDAHTDLGLIAIDPLMILGGILLIVGHVWNLRACHCFCDHSCPSEQHKAH